MKLKITGVKSKTVLTLVNGCCISCTRRTDISDLYDIEFRSHKGFEVNTYPFDRPIEDITGRTTFKMWDIADNKYSFGLNTNEYFTIEIS